MDEEDCVIWVGGTVPERHGRDPYEVEAPRDFSGFEL